MENYNFGLEKADTWLWILSRLKSGNPEYF